MMDQVIRRHTDILVDRVLYSDIQSHLQANLLNIHEEEEIDCERTNRDKMRACLRKLHYKGPDAYQIFVQSLVPQYSHIVQQMFPNGEHHQAAVAPVDEEPPHSPLQGAIEREELIALSNNSLVMEKWKMLGRLLRVTDADILQVENANSRDLHECVHNMLTLWRERLPRDEAKRESVYQALVQLGIRRTAETIFDRT